MEWAQQRQRMVLGILVAVALSFVLILGFAIFYKTPTCFDTKKDGDETGVDCGGSCSTVCSAAAQPATIHSFRTLTQSGRIDLIAYIDNPNKDTIAKDAHVTIEIYRKDGHTLVRHAILTLPESSSIPLFIPDIANSDVRQVFVTFDTGYPIWTKGAAWTGGAPKAVNVAVTGTDSLPRVTATMSNPTAYDMTSVPLVATVFANDGTIIAASQTIIPVLPAQGTAQGVFTWNEPFSQPYARIDVVPLLALPALVP